MTIREILQRPSILVLQGFIAGGILFFATHSVDAAVPPAPVERVR